MLLSAALMSLSVSAAALPSVEVVFDPAQQKLTAEVQLANQGAQFVNVIIAPADITLSVDNILNDTNDDIIIKAVQTSLQGKKTVNIVLPDSAGSRYKYYIINEGNNIEDGVFTPVKPTQIVNMPVLINTAAVGEDKAAAVNNVKTIVKENDESVNLLKGADTDYIGEYIYSVYPEGGYNGESLLDAYICGEGMSYVKKGTLTAGNFFDDYKMYLDKDYSAEYEKLTAAEKTIFDKGFASGEISGSMEKTFENNLFVVDYTLAETSADFKSVVMDYFKANSVDLTAYDAITNAVYKEAVTDELFKVRTTVSSYEAMVGAFNDEVTRQAKLAGGGTTTEPKKDYVGGGIGGGGGPIKPPVTEEEKPEEGDTENSGSTPKEPLADMADHWAEAEVKRAFEMGIVSGYEDGSYKPDNNITRAEFAKLIAAYLKLDTSKGASFADVAADSWYFGVVGAVAEAGIVKGSGDNFEPDESITREDAAVMLARMIEYLGKTLAEGEAEFKDEAEISDYAKAAVNGLSTLKIIEGYDGGFAPKDNTTRAAAAALLLRTADYIGLGE